MLRLHEADTAMLFCATRDNVRRLHASLLERGFAAVALHPASETPKHAKVLSKPFHLREIVQEVERMMAA